VTKYAKLSIIYSFRLLTSQSICRRHIIVNGSYTPNIFGELTGTLVYTRVSFYVRVLG